MRKKCKGTKIACVLRLSKHQIQTLHLHLFAKSYQHTRCICLEWSHEVSHKTHGTIHQRSSTGVCGHQNMRGLHH